ncbi:lariat debranching enzyme [Phlyctochytrium planicorne]|nr:lariat debranching enzyme [Phlyctochytrium planicorne]
MLIAVEGCAHGELDKIYQSLELFEQKHAVKIDLLLICGDFQSIRNLGDLDCLACPDKYRSLGNFYEYYSGAKKAPVLTLFIGGNHEASNYLWELYHGGWVCPNIYFLGFGNVVKFGGVRIGGLTGIYKDNHYDYGFFEKQPYNANDSRSIYHVRKYCVFKLAQVRQPIDIFMSHDWPRGIAQHGNLKKLLNTKQFLVPEINNNTLGSYPAEFLLKKLKPDYWFSAHLHVKYAALFQHDKKEPSSKQAQPVENPDEINIDLDEDEGADKAKAADGISPKAHAAPLEENKDAALETSENATIPTDAEEAAESSFKASLKYASAKLPVQKPAKEKVTRFLSLDKCLPNRDFLQVINIPRGDRDELFLEYDEEWLAVIRATEEYFTLGREQKQLPKEDEIQARIEQERKWIKKHVVDTKGLRIPENFCMSQPPHSEKHRNRAELVVPVQNPQTVAFCELAGIPCNINPDAEVKSFTPEFVPPPAAEATTDPTKGEQQAVEAEAVVPSDVAGSGDGEEIANSVEMNGEVKKTQIAPTTAEFGHIEYGLQLALQASTARIVSAYAVSNPNLSVQFDKRCKDILVLQTWIDPSQLVGVNSEDDVIRRGFQLSVTQGIKVSVGVLPSQRASTANLAGVPGNPAPGGREMKTQKKLLLCKVGIGRARVSDSLSAERDAIPDGYDSFFIKDSANMKGNGSGEYYCEYMIKNPSQILPQYLVSYEYDESKERQSRERPKCDNCEVEVATIYCSSDSANLCNKCDSQLHVSKLASRHVRTPIGKGSDVFGYCRHHPEKLIEFFCSQCHIPVCVFCKMVGNHANGEAAKHQLVSVSEAYQTVLQEAQAIDPILQSRRTEIVNQIASVSNRAKAVDKMCGHLEGQLEEIYKKAVTDLRVAVKEKLEILKGDELELKRQIGEIEFLEEFLRYQQRGDATQFLFSWARHQHCRAELHDFKFFRNEIDVELDLKISGSLSVVSESSHNLASSVSSTPNQHKKGSISKINPQYQVLPTQALTSGGRNSDYTVQPSNIQGSFQGHGAMLQMQHDQGAVTAGMVGLGIGIPKKIQDRRVQRRTSDFFAETLSLATPYNWGSAIDERGEI